ncbi:hypothetical protein BH09PAT4_BH09PAT4_07130 [soil metagenome]|jgi:gas vesicle protein
MLGKKKSSPVKSIAIGASLAAAAGYVAGILTAPKSGKQTRKAIERTAKKRAKQADKELQKLHSEFDGLVADVKAKSASVSDKTSKELTELVDKAKAAKDKAASVISAITKGEAEDKELNSAIAEANKAIDNVRKYLKK